MLFEPWPLGPSVARNRALFGPHATNLGRGRSFSPAHAAYYARRAAGGVGVVVTETISVHPSDWPYERAPLATECASSLAAVATAVHDAGAVLIASIGHTGMQGSTAYSQGVLWAPSTVPNVLTHEMPYALEDEDIAALRDATVAAAAVATAAGCDGVELNVGQYSLFRQFASGLTNHRGDAWADRAALVAAVMTDLAAATGGAVLGLRFSADELAPWAGITAQHARDLLPVIAARAHYVVIERGSIFSEAATRPDMQEPPGFNRDLLVAVRGTVPPTATVVAQGSITDVALAESLLSEQLAGAVEMTRALIADPDHLTKATGAARGAPRPCVLCNQGCQVRDVRNPIISCAVNPEAGHELDEPELALTTGVATRPAVVVGGGVAGLEAARSLGFAGARVTLRERADHLGGSLALAALLPGRERWGALLAWFEGELAALGVTVALNDPAAPGDAADVVGVGGTLGALHFRDGDDGSLVVHPVRAVFAGAVVTGRVAVLDPIGGPVGVGVAARLADAGCAVSLVTPDLVAGTQLSLTGDLVAANRRLAVRRVTLCHHTRAVGVRDGTLLLEDCYSGATRAEVVDAVVDAGPEAPTNEPWGDGTVGDAVAPRGVGPAILDGRRRAIALLGGTP